jgi:hypothetical protein
MTAQAPEVAAVLARLEKVERQNRRLRGAGIAVFVLAAAGLLMGQAMPKARIVEAEGFQLKDGQGKVRAELVVDKDGPRMALRDENGKTRVGLFVDKEGQVLAMTDENGELRAELSVSKDGQGLYLSDETGKPRATLNVSKVGPVLALYDENGKRIWSQP